MNDPRPRNIHYLLGLCNPSVKVHSVPLTVQTLSPRPWMTTRSGSPYRTGRTDGRSTYVPLPLPVRGRESSRTGSSIDQWNQGRTPSLGPVRIGVSPPFSPKTSPPGHRGVLTFLRLLPMAPRSEGFRRWSLSYGPAVRGTSQMVVHLRYLRLQGLPKRSSQK